MSPLDPPPSETIVTVYAASSVQTEDRYKRHAYTLGQVNGGGSTGLMGAATDGALSVGGQVDAVLLDIFVNAKHTGFRNVQVFRTMAERKEALSRNAHMFIALPGGLGTLDEIADVICARQLSFHEKPVVILNSYGFYDHLRGFLQEGIKRKFITEAISRAVLFADTPEEAIALVKKYTPVSIDKNALHLGEMMAASDNLHQ